MSIDTKKTSNESIIEQLMKQGMSYEDICKAADSAKANIEKEKQAEKAKKVAEELKQARIKKAATAVGKAWLELELAYGNIKKEEITAERVNQVADAAMLALNGTNSLEKLFDKNLWSSYLDEFANLFSL